MQNFFVLFSGGYCLKEILIFQMFFTLILDKWSWRERNLRSFATGDSK